MLLLIGTILLSAEYLVSTRRSRLQAETQYRETCARRLEALCQ